MQRFAWTAVSAASHVLKTKVASPALLRASGRLVGGFGSPQFSVTLTSTGVRSIATTPSAWADTSPADAKGKKSKGKKKKDPRAPKRPMNALSAYMKENYKLVKEAHQDLPFIEVAKKVQAQYNELGDAERAELEKECEADRERYAKEMVAYDKLKDDNPPIAGVRSNYSFFLKEQFNVVKATLGDKPTFAETTKAVSQKWRALSDADKEKYKKLSQEDRERYDRELEEFKSKLAAAV